MRISPEDLRGIRRVVMLACGTSWHSALIGKFMIEQLARLPVEVDYGSEFRYRDPIVDADTLAVVITQSGETADTLAALREAKAKGARSMAICNVVGSDGDARDRRHGLHPRRARDRRGVDQGVHRRSSSRCTSSRSTWRRRAARSTDAGRREHIEALTQLPLLIEEALQVRRRRSRRSPSAATSAATSSSSAAASSTRSRSKAR